MAEPAGLVLGAVGLVAMFNTLTDAFPTTTTTTFQPDRDYQILSLKLGLLQLRLARWRESVQLVDDPGSVSNALVVDHQTALAAAKILERMVRNFHQTRNLTARYEPAPSGPDLYSDSRDPVQSMTEEVEALAMKRLKASRSLKNKMHWRLYDSKKMERLIEEQAELTDRLMQLIPSHQEVR